MASYEKTTIVGNLTGTPEMKYTPSGTAVVNFTVATSEYLSKQKYPQSPQGWKESYNGSGWELTKFWRCTAWRATAEYINNNIGKGDMVMIEGSLGGTPENGIQNIRIWVGSDGEPRANYEITVNMIKRLKGAGNNPSRAPSDEDLPPGFVETNDIPW